MSGKKKRPPHHDPTPDWRDAGSRAEKSERIRAALFRAAEQVVGEVGYAGASVALITARAGVAQGTFYNYFQSRQDLLDQLLPALGQQLLEHVRTCARSGSDYAQRDSLSFRAFFSFLAQAPHFFRILNESESFAPRGHKAHFDTTAAGYVEFLKKGVASGEFHGWQAREMEVVAYVLMAARSYLAWRYVYGEERHAQIPDWVSQVYDKLISYGLKGQPAAQLNNIDGGKARAGAKQASNKGSNHGLHL